jgi:peptidoglycan/LPS O-acetylase OafA/YrhL
MGQDCEFENWRGAGADVEAVRAGDGGVSDRMEVSMAAADPPDDLYISKRPSVAKSGGHRLRRLDGLRALAVLMVFVHHVYFPAHGWEGVTLFFVLSGFLITGILRRARMQPDFWRSFYIKRATRILPPLVIFFLITISFYRPPLWSMPFYIGFAANIMESIGHSMGSHFVVLWSLSVEEHFYLLWPIAVRFLSRRRLIQLSIGILVVDPLLRVVATPWFSGYAPIYMLTPFQIDGLAAGSLIALLNERDEARPAFARWSGPAMLSLTVLYVGLSYLVPSFSRDENTRLFNGLGYSMILLGMAALLAYVYYRPGCVLSRILASPPVFFLGSISYGFYLFHYVMQDIAADIMRMIYAAPHGRRAQPLGFLLALGLSWLSFHFYEKPILLWGRKLAERPGDTKSPALPDV